MFNFAAVALLLSCCLCGITAGPLERKAAGVITSCKEPNVVALTFDDGPYDYLQDIVNALRDVGGKGTFFFNGDNWRCIYDDAMVKQVKYAFDNGFQVASHTWSHPYLSTLNEDQIQSEMSQVEVAIRKITGAQVAFTRPPFGDYNDLVVKVANDRNQNFVTWDFDSGDSTGVAVSGQKAMYDGIMKNRPSNVLSLQHEVYTTTLEVVRYAINALKKDYKFVTVAECLGEHPYLSVANASARDGSWHC